MHLTPHYLVYTNTRFGIGTSDPLSFTDACDEYSDQRDDGDDALVFRIDPPVGDKAGMATDVTEDADEVIRRRLRARHWDFPDWLVAA